MNPHVWWYAARACGLVGWALLTAAVVWGIALSTRLLGRRPTPAWLLDLHRFLGGLAVIFVGLHIGALVADSYVHFGLRELLVPFASSWRPVPVALGIVAFYLLVAVETTSLVRRKLPAKWWRRVHMTSFPVWVLSSAHLLLAGTDVRSPELIGSFVVGLTVMSFVTAVRVLSPKPDHRAAPVTRPAPPRDGELPAALRLRADRSRAGRAP
ncbi:MAG: ferric reductase-like transmembrane domain-containing protein [Acidobacteria bacterium]|nr:ferric reductase-like transmembrane domain-containing protein [Acidobacteriota bacterium]